MSGIPLQEYKERVELIRAAMRENGYDALILFSDSTRQSNVKYVVDFRPIDGYSDISMAVVVLPLDGEPTLYVSFMNLLWAEEVAWFTAKPFEDMVAGLFQLRSKLGRRAKVGIAGLSLMPVGVYDVIKGVFGMSQIELAPAEPILGRIKAKKSAAEIALMRRAGELTVVGLEAIKQAVTRDGPKTEREVAAFAASEMFRAGGDGPAMDIQIQSGLHSSYNNIRSTDRQIVPGDSILIEMGARYKSYVTDIARGATYGNVDKRQVEIIQAASDALGEGCESVRPGMTAGELNDIIEGALIRSGYREYSAEARGYGTGHGIGTDIEEEEPWIRPGSTFVLEKDMVIALKASIFVPGLAGVRVEDEVLVTDNGAQILTPYPRVLNW